MARWLYTVLLTVLTPLIVLRLYWRSLKAPGYREHIAERFGFLSPVTRNALKDGLKDSSPLIWFHPVSVGETMAIAELVKRLQKSHPAVQILITNTTATGAQCTQRLFGDSVLQSYAPYDLPFVIRRFLNTIKPAAIAMVETEVWPNWVHVAKQKNIPVLLLNARLSEKSLRGYKKVSALSRPMFAALTHVFAQADADKQRLVNAGVSAEHCAVSGNLKFDMELSQQQKESAVQLLATLNPKGERLVWLAASTHEGEDEILLQAHQQVLKTHPSALLVLVPRHPERFNDVYSKAQQHNLSVVRRSLQQNAETASVYLADTMGELITLMGAATIVFMGGSLVPVGGHNMLEAAMWRVSILTGEHVFNFQTVFNQLKDNDAIIDVGSGQTAVTAIADAVVSLYSDKERMNVMGNNARHVVDVNRGSVDKHLEKLSEYF